MFYYIPVLVMLILFLVVAGLGLIDRKKKRPLASLPALSFMIPCYNDFDSVEHTLNSIYDVCDSDMDVIVIDDGSTDGSGDKLAALQSRYGFILISNPSNIGKADALNKHFHLTRNEIVVFIDADVIVNRQSLTDVIARLQRRDVGAVSCPYRAANPGFIPLMQSIEYNMLSFIKGAYNIFSAIALWGGFAAIKRQAFLDVGGFSASAITEDMDMAFKLNKYGWRVEQSFYPIFTTVPETFSQWFRQKMRWSSGGIQCFIRHYRVLAKNPLQILFLVSFCIFLLFSAINIWKHIFLLNDMITFFNLSNKYESLWRSLYLTHTVFDAVVMKDLRLRMALTLFSLPFVFPLVLAEKRYYLCFMVIPFSIIYIPAFSLVSVVGMLGYFRKRRSLQAGARAW